jgi:hypothetical protein
VRSPAKIANDTDARVWMVCTLGSRGFSSEWIHKSAVDAGQRSHKSYQPWLSAKVGWWYGAAKGARPTPRAEAESALGAAGGKLGRRWSVMPHEQAPGWNPAPVSVFHEKPSSASPSASQPPPWQSIVPPRDPTPVVTTSDSAAAAATLARLLTSVLRLHPVRHFPPYLPYRHRCCHSETASCSSQAEASPAHSLAVALR